MRFTAIFLIAMIAMSAYVSANADCENCKNALRTADSKIPSNVKRTKQVVEDTLTNYCQQALAAAGGALPVGVPVPLPIAPCSLPTVHKNELVQGLIARKEYSLVCKQAGLC
eukprot:gene12129-14191_t